MKYLLLIGLLAFVGCESQSFQDELKQKRHEENYQTLSKRGDFIGRLPDGRIVDRYRLRHPDPYGHDHYIYVVEGTESVTLNKSVQSGKHTHNETETFITD
jgi:hypothetical protein